MMGVDRRPPATRSLRDHGRVLYACSVDVSLPNGPGVNEREFLIALFTAMGSRAHAIVPEPENSVDDLPLDGISWVRPMNRRRPGSVLAHKRDLIMAIDARIADEPPDLLVVRLDIAPVELLHLARNRATPLAVKTLGASFATPPGGRSIRKRVERAGWRAAAYVQKEVSRRLLEQAVAVDACTHELCQRAIDLMGVEPGKIRLIPNATNTERFQPADQKTARERMGLGRFGPVIGFVGGRPSLRGGRQMIEAAPRLVDDFPDLGIVIVGGGPGMEALRDLAAHLGVSERLVLPGVVPYPTIPDYVNCFDVGFALDDARRHQEFGNSYQKVRQYIACGKPVVSVEATSLPLEEAGLGTVVDPDDIEGIVRAVGDWLRRDEASKDRHQQKAAEFARLHLSVQSTLAQRFDFWDERLALSR